MLSNVPHVVSPLGPTWREAVANDSKLRDFGRDLDLHAHHIASRGRPSPFDLGPTSAPPDPLAPAWAPVGSKPRWTELGGSSGPSWAQPGPILRTQCDTLKACIFTSSSNVFLLWEGVQGHVAHIDWAPSWAEVFGPT